MENEKIKALDTAIAGLEKKFGKGTLMRMGEASHVNVDVISSGSLSLDYALGVGGLPRGRIIEIFGPESSGKTTVALHAVAEAQKLGGVALYIDLEHALDPVYAESLGVDIDNLLISQPETGEQAFEIAEALMRSGAIDVVVFDSVAAMATQAEIEGDIGDSHVGTQARLMSSALRKLASVISKNNTLAIFINQLREKIGVMYGNPETTPGGRALKFYSSVRLDVRKTEALKNKDGSFYGNKVKVKVVKNKVAPPFKEAEFTILFGKGISKETEIVNLAVKFNVIEKSGSWFSYNGERLAQGLENTCTLVNENKKLFDEITEKVRYFLTHSNEIKAPASSLNVVENKIKATKVSADIEDD